MISKEQKLAFLNMPFEEKIQRTKELILEWYLQFEGKVYVGFSGGKDSTVLLHIARSIKGCSDIPAVFADTGLEYPEIREFVKTIDNVTWLKPKLTFKQVLEKYGYPIISKQSSDAIKRLRKPTTGEKYRNKLLNGDERGSFGKLAECWKPLINSGFKISSDCCNLMKKKPFHDYEKQTGRKGIIGVMADESQLRYQMYMKGNCNAFNAKRPLSKPLSFWNEQDILEYIVHHNLEIASIYGVIYRGADGLLRTTNAHRTGCMFCMYGLHLEEHPNRFERMKETHPKQYEYCMDKLGLRKVIDEYLNCWRK